jgi:hypothetical protein
MASVRVLTLEQWLEGLSVVSGVLAALLWLRSAFVHIPLLPGGAIGATLPGDAFNVAMHDAAFWNFWAAAATAISVLLPVVAEVVRRSGRRLEP